MLRQNLWKLLLTLAIIIWSVAELMPFKDREFVPYVRAQATAKQTEFVNLMKEASDRVASKQAPSVYIALKQIGKERKLDLSQFFPQYRLEASLKNVEKRNSILLDEILKRSKGALQLGLDLKGGVAFTLEVNEKAAAATSPRDSEQKLSKAIEIISTRINGLGVAEPIVRPVGTNRIEVQLAGVSTKDNPEIISSLKKPARLDFRLVYPDGTPQTIPASEAPPGYEAMTMEQEGRNGEIHTIFSLRGRIGLADLQAGKRYERGVDIDRVALGAFDYGRLARIAADDGPRNVARSRHVDVEGLALRVGPATDEDRSTTARQLGEAGGHGRLGQSLGARVLVRSGGCHVDIKGRTKCRPTQDKGYSHPKVKPCQLRHDRTGSGVHRDVFPTSIPRQRGLSKKKNLYVYYECVNVWTLLGVYRVRESTTVRSYRGRVQPCVRAPRSCSCY